MKKLESSLINMVLVLVGVAMIMGCVLAYVNHLTSKPIEEQKQKALTEGIKTVMSDPHAVIAKTDTLHRQDNKGKELTFIIYQVQNDRQETLGTAVESTTLGFGGNLKVLVGFNAEGTIVGYTLREHTETPGLGAKADQWFQRNGKGCIIGKNPGAAPLDVKPEKGGQGDVDAITASTITTKAFLKAVNQAYDAYSNQSVAATTGASQQKQ